VTKIASCLLVAVVFSSLALADDVSFNRVKVPDPKGKPTPAVLTFSDADKAIEIRPQKGDAVTIPYSEIDTCSYEYTRKHRINDLTVITAPLGVGAVAMMTKSRSHWLEIHYMRHDIRNTYILRMEKHEYLRILDAVKAHTGKDVEILGNAVKR